MRLSWLAGGTGGPVGLVRVLGLGLGPRRARLGLGLGFDSSKAVGVLMPGVGLGFIRRRREGLVLWKFGVSRRTWEIRRLRSLSGCYADRVRVRAGLGWVTLRRLE